MSKSVKKIMLIGWDGAPPQIVERMIAEGRLKNATRLMKEGTFIYALNPYPTSTASNWTTVSTGAWPGRHSVTDYFVHHPGDPLDKLYSGFNTAECVTEHIWDTAERIGKKCILVHYETAWPPTLKKGIVVGGCGPNYQDEFLKITPDMVFSTETYPGIPVSEPVEIEERDGTCCARLKFKTAANEERIYYVEWKEADRKLNVYKSDEKAECMCSLAEGEWSAPVHDQFLFEGKQADTTFLFRLLHLPDADDDEFKLLCTTIMPTREFAYPKDVGVELVEKLGPYHPRGGWESAAIAGPEIFLERLDMYHDWLAGACQHLLDKGDWDLLYAQTHCQDYVHHLYMRAYDPVTADRERMSLEDARSYVERAYESADRMLGRILEYADDETLIAVVSDHGAKTWLANIDVRGILVKKGLMVVDPDTQQVVWEKTKAVPQRASYVYVNVKGRDPQGIVEPGEEYEAVRDEIIEAFYDYVEPESKKRPFSLVLKREDARVLGIYGPRIGDIVYAVHSQFGHEHGQGLATARFSEGSLEALILLAGPGIKRGFKHEGMTGIQDLVPTFCYLADIPFPAGCEGAIIYDALEDPSCKMKERAKLQKELDRWKDAYQKQASITHSGP